MSYVAGKANHRWYGQRWDCCWRWLFEWHMCWFTNLILSLSARSFRVPKMTYNSHILSLQGDSGCYVRTPQKLAVVVSFVAGSFLGAVATIVIQVLTQQHNSTQRREHGFGLNKDCRKILLVSETPGRRSSLSFKFLSSWFGNLPHSI